MSGDSRSTTNHNVEVLHLNGFKKLSNTSIFEKGNVCLLSPAASCGKSGKYWFDIREVNITKIKDSNNPLILIRIIPDKFILFELPRFSFMLSKETRRFRKKSGYVWGFNISLGTMSSNAQIFSTADSTLTFATSILENSELASQLKAI
jgi:hypothetical protein